MAETITREQLRDFHITGKGLEELAPAAPLYPAELAALDVPKRAASAAFHADAAVLLHAAALINERKEARQRFLTEVRHYRDQLQGLLTGFTGRTAEMLAAALAENQFFDTNVLASAINRSTPGHRTMDPERRSRILDVLATLEHAVQEAETEPVIWVFDTRPNSPDVTPLGGRTRETAAAFTSATALCEEQLQRLGRVIRALRTARLETAGAFDAALHGPAIERLDWQAADAEEVKALPAILIVETKERLAETTLTAFGRILRSGHPVQILVLDTGANPDALHDFIPDFGYLAIAHREAFVLQSSLACTDHLTEGLKRLAASLRPAVAVISVPRDTADIESAWAECVLLYVSRTHPLYSYDPDAGDSWMTRFQLREDGAAETLTAAHAAALSPAFGRHFRILPPNAPADEQVDIVEYLKQYAELPPLSIPFIQLDGKRAVITRELANLCRDRKRAWRILEELAGMRNAYVEAAVIKAREEALAFDADRENKAKQDGATDAIYKVVAMLTNP